MEFSIENLVIASPCPASWDSMEGNDTARFCSECKKNVYNISELTRAEAIDLIREKEGSLCVKLFRRADGTVLTADCPVGLRTVKRTMIKARVKMSLVAASFAGLLGLTLSACMGSQAVGELAAPVPDSTHSVTHDSTSTVIKP